ncbi:nitroreductase family protein [Nesterenkonia alba]|uniref:nitroreductase family protein n=1 Tax=Nesterenkonia alba TaxID=515814 RepID=UPI0003B7AE47|nr:nitroreductase family protein [Nesterenkonia alba]
MTVQSTTAQPTTAQPEGVDAAESATGHQRLRQRYGAEQHWQPPAWNQTLDVLLRHRSVRQWRDEPVDDATLRTLIAAGQSGSTSSNQQIVSVVAVRDPERKQALAEVGGPRQAGHISTAPVVLVWLIDYSHARRLAEQAGAQIPGQEYLDAVLVAATDIGIAGQNTVVAAESLGLGAVFLGSLRNDVDRVAEILNLPEGVVAFLGLEIGHPDPEEPAGIKPRLPQEAVLHFEEYDADRAAAAYAGYDDTLAEYYAGYGQQHVWSRQLLKRLSEKATTSTQRHLLRRAFEKAQLKLR